MVSRLSKVRIQTIATYAARGEFAGTATMQWTIGLPAPWTMIVVVIIVVIVIIIVVIITAQSAPDRALEPCLDAALDHSVVLIPILVLVFLGFLFLLEHSAFCRRDLGGQLGRLAGSQKHFFLGADVVLPQFEQALVQEKHAAFAPRLNRRVDTVSLVFADEVLDG